jgi:hypothetical protein
MTKKKDRKRMQGSEMNVMAKGLQELENDTGQEVPFC